MNKPTDGRRCNVCGGKLSCYNLDILCFACQEKDSYQYKAYISSLKNFTLVRTGSKGPEIKK